MPAVRLVVLDFDGTMTDVEEEGLPFRAGYLADLALLVGREVGEVERLADDAEVVVAQDLERYGWVYEGHIVAPASVDPYLRMMPVSRMVLDRCGVLLGDETFRDRLLSGLLYRYNYAKTVGRPAFRPEAFAFLRSLCDLSPRVGSYIVSNSDPAHIAHKIRALAAAPESGGIAGLADRTVGNAKKYVIDDGFAAIPERELRLPGLRSRPVLLRRAHYFRVLDGLRAAAGLAWDEVLVAGDIFELDLALPYALGARVALVANARTPAYERDFVASVGRVVTDLREILTDL